MSVAVRKNTLKNGMSSIYFDIYYQGRTEYYNPKIRVYTNPKNQIEREYNKEAKIRIGIIKAQKELELQEQETNIVLRNNTKQDFVEFFKTLAETHKKVKGTYDSWLAAISHFKSYTNGKKIGFNDLNETLIYGFRAYLLEAKDNTGEKKLKTNSALTYFDKCKSAVLKAYKQGYLKAYPINNIDSIKKEDTLRSFLTDMEIQQLKETDCQLDVVKRAFLFACFTGLRHSDILKLQWSDFHYSNSEKIWKISHTQQKTKSHEVLPVPNSAMIFVGEIKNDDSRVFKGLEYSSWQNEILKKWVKEAGVSKRITFHCSRHTYATMLLTKGVDIYTVQKLLGHKDIANTQIYAKVVDSKKNEAVGVLDGIL